MAFERYILREAGDNSPTVSLHLLRALLEQFLTGSKTDNETKNAIEAHLGIALTTNDVADLIAITDYISGGADLFAKKNRMDEFYRVIICSKEGAYWTTRDELRTKLAWSEID